MRRTTVSILAALMALPAVAEPVGITRDMMSVTVETPGGPVVIERIQDNDNRLEGEFALTSRPCPNFCIQPMQVVEGVETIGELEMLEALQDPEVTVLDSRVRPDWQGGTIPGALSMPYNEMPDRLGELGCEPDFEGFICEDAAEIVLFCNGPWCGQSPAAIRGIVEAGYPPERIRWYRWGMQGWRILGLTVAQPGEG